MHNYICLGSAGNPYHERGNVPAAAIRKGSQFASNYIWEQTDTRPF